MILNGISELYILGVYERGIPNRERIVLKAAESVNMGQFGLMLGVIKEQGFALPIRDNLFWFGDGHINKGDWIFIYTGPGEFRVDELPNSNEKLYAVHWGRDKVILGQPEIVPILFRMDAVDIATETPVLENTASQG